MDKRFWGVMAAIVLVVGGIIVFHGGDKAGAPSSATSSVTNHVEGKGTTGVTFVEYGDYQCPACYQFYTPVKQAVASFGDKIKYQFRNFPLTSLHPNAFSGARAAEAASLQGKFWGMHDLLYQNQDPTGKSGWVTSSNALDDYFVGFAKQLGLDVAQFKKDFASSKVNNAINADMAEGNKLNITGTPTFFLDGKKLDTPNPDAATFTKLIQQAIDDKTKK